MLSNIFCDYESYSGGFSFIYLYINNSKIYFEKLKYF